jgi:hypothetical protein
VADLIVGIVMNILGKVSIQYLKRSGVSWIPTPPGNLAILYPAEFVVLHPEVGLQDFGCCSESEHGGVSLSQTTATLASFFRESG